MNYRMVGYLLGVILLIEAALMSLPLAVSLIFNESPVSFIITIALILLVALPFVIFKPQNTQIYAKEGFVTVSAGWILMSLLGALPFVISGAIPNYINAFFETVSGFTTTGATILSDIEILPRGILFWRSFTHWIGGMGVLVFMLAILPSSGGQAMHLIRAEVPGPTKGKLVPKMRQSAIILYAIYMALTVIQIIALLICKLPLYDSVVTSFSVAGTGGFSVLNDSIAGYNNPAAEWVITVFMILFGINFNIFFFILIGKIRDVIKNEELRAYLAIYVVVGTIVAINIAHSFTSLGTSIRTAFFHTASIMTTTGFVTMDINTWPVLSKSLIILIMIIGSCAGSTAGGLKVSRVLILLKGIFREIKKALNPRSVTVVRMNGETLPSSTLHSATSYLVIYITLIILGVLSTAALDGYSFETSLTATLTCINNVGPILGDIGTMGNFADYSYFSKIFFSILMFLGRLEIIPMLILFSPSTWKKR